ncbi:uncharacterized protein J8A68_005284 [[Candida] subhashii]|uniref:Mannosyltransferase n=1 Tax=[Candida] subhashii TaxID=561895 RepID=A0A8J5Q3L4_9ASCO|nr:uncharacterized protein J8A68_005284 [[Candida] subhashii]KAG7661199.1 hypothetical protein J8A68_005284 [[Candida] subhashii]
MISPYTKVEESFNLQAIHDILNYGIYPQQLIIENYDHIKFPGVVPRTFIGSLIIAGLSQLVIKVDKFLTIDLLSSVGKDQLELQTIVRSIIGLVNIFMLLKLRDSINKISFKYKNKKSKYSIGFWYTILLMSQFHLLYYSSRTLPNFIVLPLVNYSISKLIVGDLSGLTWLAFCGIIFRLEIGLFAVIIALVSSIIFGQSNIFINIVYLAAGSLIGGLTSICIDSYFWNRLLIPELDSFIFNIIEGKSSQWGVEPWPAYFRHYLWQLFRPPIILLLALPGLINDPADNGTTTPTKTKTILNHPARNSLRILFISSLLYIIAMSFQPHKEWRFIIYTIPIFTLQAANGLTNIFHKTTNLMNKLLFLIIMAGILLSTILSIQMGYVSSFNYPGGNALQFTNNYITQNPSNSDTVIIHMDVPACMTGVSRFGEIHNNPNIKYDKTEDQTQLESLWNQFDFIITHDEKLDPKSWELIYTEPIFKGITIEPIVELLIAQSKDRSIIINLIKNIIDELVKGESNTLINLLRSTILTEDYLNVYKALTPHESTMHITPESTASEPQDIDPESLKKEINQQIDNLEESFSAMGQ